MQKLYKVESASRLMTYEEALSFLWHTQNISRREAEQNNLIKAEASA